jgi:hypothetical protein
MESSYSAWNLLSPLTLFIVGPVIVNYNDANGWYSIEYIARERLDAFPLHPGDRLGVLFPVWLARPFIYTSARELAEAVERMRLSAIGKGTAVGGRIQ